MKKILLASTFLAGSAGFAAADVGVTGGAGFGMMYDGTDWTLGYSATVTFSMTGETDGGLMFGASMSIWGSQSASSHTGVDTMPTVWISGDFGKLSVGDVDSGDEAVVGGLADIGWSGLGVDNIAEALKGNAADILYTGTFSDFTIGASYDTGTDAWAIGAGYSFGDYNVALGYNSDDVVSVSAGGSFGDFGVNLLYATNTVSNANAYGIHAAYTTGAITIGAGYSSGSAGTDAYGLDVSYDLGGGANLAAGVASVGGTTVADFGISMSF